VVPGPDSTGIALGKRFDFQFTYEHNARATAATNPDYRYVNLPDEIDLSDAAKDSYYRQYAVVVLPRPGHGPKRAYHLSSGRARGLGHHDNEECSEPGRCGQVP
jgi:hypothetical protein